MKNIINSSTIEENNKISDSSLIIKTQTEKENNSDNKDYEELPILSQLQPVKTSLEDFYRINYPEFQIIKFYRFTFIRMGKLLTFNFDKNNNYIPKYSIGPQWYLTVLLLFIIFLLFYFINSAIFYEARFLEKLIFVLFILIEYIFVLKTDLTHAKIVMNKKKNIGDNGFCNFCKVYYNPSNKVEHCNFCKVCAEKMDHHCIWVGKCVAKNNTFYFYAMIANIFFIYAYIIIYAIFMSIKK